MIKRSGKSKVRLVPKLSSYHTELQKRVAIIGVSLVIILVLVGLGLYVSPGKFVGKAVDQIVTSNTNGHQGSSETSADLDSRVATSWWISGAWTSYNFEGYCEGTNFCLSLFSNEYCYAPGSILSSTLPVYYCAQAFNGKQYVWVTCDSSTRFELTEDSTFICDDINSATAGGYEWTQCANDGDLRGDYRCDGEKWQACGDGTKFICEGRTAAQGPLECNEDRKFETADRKNAAREIVQEDGYYCSYDGTTYAWVQCKSGIIGEGVDNADHAERYGNNYVCGLTSTSFAIQWFEIPQCAVCAGTLPGECVGSSTVNIRTGNRVSISDTYYSSETRRTDRVGCVAAGECFYQHESTFDEKNEVNDQVCTADSQWSKCTSTSGVPMSNENSRWLCDVDGNWQECTDDTPGTQLGNFICSYNSALQKWVWLSEFSCSPAQKYQIRDDDEELDETQRICDGTGWITPTCEELGTVDAAGNTATLGTDNPFTDPDVEVVCDDNGKIVVNELICNNDDDDDNDGLTDCEDLSSCLAIQTPILNEDHLYEYALKQTDCFSANIDIDDVAPPVYTGLNVCDVGTEPFGNRVTLCHAAATDNTITLDSTALLANRFGRPYIDTNNLAFLFKESTPKTASVMLHREITAAAPLMLPLATFAPNFVAGQRVMLGVDGESYLLWHSTGNMTTNSTPSFSEANLKLTHIATNTVIPAQIYPGTNVYTFTLPGSPGRLVTVVVDTERGVFEIQALRPDETPQSFPVPTDLTALFEAKFSKASPIRIINPVFRIGNPESGLFSLCREGTVAEPYADNNNDHQQAMVCRGNDFAFSLRVGNLTKIQIEASNYAFLLEVVNNVKQVSIFPIYLLSPAIGSTTSLYYNPFVDSMVAGRRAAVEFENKLYLLSHPATPPLSLPSITLTRYLETVTTTFPALGSQDLVDFLTPEGKISIQRQYGTPPPPFRASALRVQDIAPVDLDDDFSTTMSSLVPVTVNDELVRADDEQYESDESVFRITIGRRADTDTPLLHLQLPVRVGFPFTAPSTSALFYYRTVTSNSNQLVKQVSIYRLYDLSAGTQSHDYNEEFRRALAGGKEFAITLNPAALPEESRNYYLVGYENNNNEVLSFNINRLRLFTLDKTTTIPAIPDTGGVRFDLPNGARVRFMVNYVTGMLEMQTGLELLTEIPFTGYMTELNPTNEIKINTTANFRMCYLTAYAMLPGARVCDTVGAPDVDALANPLTLVPGSESYVLEVNGQTGNDKRVFVRNLTVIPVSPAKYEIDDWFAFVSEIVAHREPYFLVNNRLYLPQATDGRLETFRLKQYPDGTPQAPRNVRAKTPLTANGSIVLIDQVIVIDQQETTDEEHPVNATFRIQPYYYLSDNHDVVRFNSTGTHSISFVIAVDGTQYTLGTSDLTAQLVRLSLATNQEPLNPLLNRLFAQSDTRTLNLAGVQVEIKVEAISPEDGIINAQITVKRR